MRIGACGVMVLLAASLDLGIASIASTSPLPRQPARPQAAQQSSDQEQARKQDQKQGDALAEAARRAREQKKQQPKAGKVWDNDNIPTKPGTISVVGESGTLSQAAATSAAARAEPPSKPEAAAPAEAAEKATGTDEERKAALKKELEEAKEHLQSVSADLDILSRKYALDQQTYYGKPDYTSDAEGAVALKVEGSEIASKKQEVADAQKKVDDLETKLKSLEQQP